MSVLAIDPGYEQSAWVMYDGTRILGHGIEDNASIVGKMSGWPADAIVFESIESYGMAVGREVFETVFWTGRMYQAVILEKGGTLARMPRKAVKLHLCESARATDSNIRVALVDRFGGKVAAIGSKKAPGPLYGIKSHEWAALAIAVTWWDQRRGGGVL